MAAVADWIAVDWGTSNLRAWAMSSADEVLDMRESDAGMGRLEQSQFEGALLSLVEDWLKPGTATDVVACGMVGARQGWMEAAYRAIPCTPAGPGALTIEGTDARIRVSILPGLKQETPADVMRGEETQIAGYLAENTGFSGSLCLPGTHSKWAQISGGEVVSFTTFMTGEMFALLTGQSVLRFGIAKEGWDADAFAEALRQTVSAPTEAPATLFRLRAEGLLANLAPEAALSKLSGILLGMELAATRAHWHDAEVAIIGASKLAQRYAEALTLLGGKAESVDGNKLTLAGLVAAYRQLHKEKA